MRDSIGFSRLAVSRAAVGEDLEGPHPDLAAAEANTDVVVVDEAF